MKSDLPTLSTPATPLFDTLVVYGVGLLGGSVALAAKSRHVARHIVGMGRHAERLATAQQAGVIDSYCTDPAKIPPQTDLFVAAAPVDRIAGVIREVIPALPANCLVTDVGSTKVELAASLADLTGEQGTIPFVGSHPIAGGDKAGFEYASGDLFLGRTCVICPDHVVESAVIKTERFWRALGMQTIRMSAQEHDEALATTSHLPHVAAAALAGILPAEWQIVTGAGFRDTSRVAMGPSELWVSILESNREPVVQSLERLKDQLGAFVEALKTNDSKKLLELLQAGEIRRKQLDIDES